MALTLEIGDMRTSVVTQCGRIRLPVQEPQVQSLIREDPPCCGAYVPQLLSLCCRAHMAQLLSHVL